MQTNYSLINPNIENISPMQGFLINNTRKPVLLCRPMKNILPIRFYPGSVEKVLSVITTESAKRLLKHFHNNQNFRAHLKDKLPHETASVEMIKTVYNIMGNRSSFLKTMREISLGQEHVFPIMPHKMKNTTEYYNAFNTLGSYVYILHLNRMSEEHFNAHSMRIEDKKEVYGKKKNEAVIESYVDLLRIEAENKRNLVQKFERFAETFSNDKTLDKEFINEWKEYVRNRKPIYKLDPDELFIQHYLLQLYNKNYDQLKKGFREKDLLFPFLSKTTVDLKWALALNSKCYTTQDYNDNAAILQQIKDFISNNYPLNDNDLIILAVKLGVIEINEYGQPKITKKANEYIYSVENPVGLQESFVPDSREIVQRLIEKAILVLNHDNTTPSNAIAPTPSSSHKAITLLLQQHAVKTAIYTSTSNNNDPCTRLVGRQEMNRDFVKSLKKEYISLLKPFVISEDKELRIDLLGQGYLINQNLVGQDVFTVCKKLIMENKNIWGMRAAIFNPVIDEMFLRKVVYKFCDDAIKTAKEDSENHADKFKGLTSFQRKELEEVFQKDKEIALEKERDQKIISSLSEEYVTIYTCDNQMNAIKIQEAWKEQKKKKSLPVFPVDTSDLSKVNLEERISAKKTSVPAIMNQ